jgi:hypothetical protein
VAEQPQPIVARARPTLMRAWRRWNLEQRVAAVASGLLVVSTFGPFSFVELAEILLAAGVLALLVQRAEGKRFHLPFGDGSVIFAAGVWAGLLIVVRLFDRPLGQNLLALGCASVLALAGAREKSKRPMDDLPAEAGPPPPPGPREPQPPVPRVPSAGPATPAARRASRPESAPTFPDEDVTTRLPDDESATRRIPAADDDPTVRRRREPPPEPDPEP